MGDLDKAQLEAELLQAQKEKVQAEIAVLKRTTPLTEGIKIIGSLVVGIGGAIAAVFGFQFAEVKAEKYQMAADKATRAKDSATKELSTLTLTREKLRNEINNLQNIIAQNAKILEQLSDKVAAAETESNSSTLQTIQQDINAAAIDLRSSAPSSVVPSPAKPLNTLIAELFGDKASTRGAAFNQLLSYHANSPELIPALLQYANEHLDNQNGIYNTLVLHSRLDYKKVPRDVKAIRSFAERTRNNGPKTVDRVEKLLPKLRQ